MRSIVRWLKLAPAERWRLLGIVCALPIISASLRLTGVVRTRRWLERMSPQAGTREAVEADVEDAQRIAALAAIAGRRGLIVATCLRHALLVYTVLRRRGFSPALMLGVRKVNNSIDAHAWVRLQGVDLGYVEPTHTPFPERNWALSGTP
jgi:hypothetical protein